MPVGRLDLNTEGLLLLTNDGELKRALELPATGIPRTYRARTFGDISQDRLEELIEGIEIDGVRYGQIDANMERRTGRNQWIELTLTEGKNREVRRVLEHLGFRFRACCAPPMARSSWPTCRAAGPRKCPRCWSNASARRSRRLPPSRNRKIERMRIIAGQWRGRKLNAPAGDTTRPTSDRTRETLFSMLASRLGDFEGLKVADLFAGSGALGWKRCRAGPRTACSWSRTPPRSARSAPTLPRSARKARPMRASSVLSLGPVKEPLDLILLDPPYGTGAGAVAVDKLVRLGWIGAGTWVSLETHADEVPQIKACEVESERKVGKARLTLLRLKAKD
jgi:16S rRNA (guanine966-N2)-methyltransferase